MRLITFNTWQGRLSRNFLPFFKEQHADIVCLQELNSSTEPTGDWLDTFRGLQAIQENSGLKNQYFSPTYSYGMMGVTVDYGNGLLSRYPLSNQQTVFTHGQHTRITKADDHVHNTRNAQTVTIASPSGDLTVVNTHAHWDKDPMGSELSVSRLEKLIESLKDVQGPLVVAGDFNLKSESEALQFFKTALGLTDLTLEYGLNNTLSNLVTPYQVACDHIFINDHITVENLQLHEELLSDHKALALDFDIKD
jgi:endonuclease/exonuclease/phosphatase family metal-dependent hydrolase